MDQSDLEATRVLRREFNRRQIDITLADLRVLHGVAYIRGTIAGTRGSGSAGNIREEVDHVVHVLRGRSEFRDIVVDASFRG